MTEKFIKEYDKDLYLFEQKEYCKELAFEMVTLYDNTLKRMAHPK